MPVHYHISTDDLGEFVELIPKVPMSANCAECRETLRVCFSPTLLQCMVGKYGTTSFSGICSELIVKHRRNRKLPIHNPAVYRTTRKLHQPELVSDFATTEEKWALDPIWVRRAGYLNVGLFLQKGIAQLTKATQTELPAGFIDGFVAGIRANQGRYKKTE